MSAPSSVAGSDARAIASAMSGDLREVAGDPLRFHGIDLGPAVEQVLFTALRAGVPRGDRRQRVLEVLRRPMAAVASLRRSGAAPRSADVMVLLLAGVHRMLFAPVEQSIGRLRPELRVVEIAAGRATRDPLLADLPSANDLLNRPSAIDLLGHSVDRRAVAVATRSWDGMVGQVQAAALRRFAAQTIIRLAVEAARIEAAVMAVRPRLVATYDEIDAWGRLLTAVAHRHDAIAVDLPHAEAVDVEAIRGVTYDLMGVYGPRAAAVVEAAGVARGRIEIVGPAHFDGLVRAARTELGRPPRVILAGQYRAGRMTDQVRSGTFACAVAAAEAIGGVLHIQPHPVELPSTWERIIAARRIPMGTEVRVESGARLHDLLPGAALLVTAWSNSVYEAVLAGVPALTVHLLDGEPPMPFAAEGIAGEARNPSGAAQLAVAYTETVTRELALATARRALADHLGPLDGAATERTAHLIMRPLLARD